MAQISTALLEVDKIDIEEGFNARRQIDPDALERLVGTVEEAGVVQAIRVRPKEKGRYWLVAGERRLRAARKAQVKSIPGVVHHGTRAEAVRDSLLENLHKEELNDVDLAHGIQALAEEWGLRTNQEIADRLGLRVDRVGLLRRIAKLPEGVQKYIAAGAVPGRAEKQLREVAGVSPRVAECVCEFAARTKIDHVDFVRDFADVLLATSQARFDDAPTMARANHVEVRRVVADKGRRAELIDRFNASVPWGHLASEDPVISFKEAELDAARAAGCLVEYVDDHGRFVTTVQLVTDAELVVDLVERRIESMEADAARREEAAGSAHKDDPEAKAALSEQRKAEREKRDKDKVAAERFNEELLAGLTNRNAPARRKHGLARRKALAKIVIANNPDLAGAGLRFVRPALKDVEVKTLKSGEPRVKVSYASPAQATEWLLGRIEGARSEGEVDDLMAEAVICALAADDKAVARSGRFGWHCVVAGEVEELLAAEIAEVLPAKKSKKKSGGKEKAAI